MLSRITVAALAVVAATAAATAADLPAQTRLGTVFAEPIVPPPAGPLVKDLPMPFVPWLGTSPRVAGLYGQPGDFYYTNYYGTSWLLIFSRMPYSCAFYGRC